MPKHLRGVSGYENDYQQALKLKEHVENTAIPEIRPKEYETLWKRVDRRYRELKLTTNQHLWKNYKGIKVGPAPDRFKTKKF